MKLKKRAPKAVKGWAILHPDNDVGLLYFTISGDRATAQSKVSRELPWAYYVQAGYRCIPVLITPLKRKAKR